MKFHAPMAFAALVFVSACSPARDDTAPTGEPSADANGLPAAETGSDSATSTPTPMPSESATAPPSPPPTGSPSLSVRDLNLKAGVYAAAGSSCPPAMASLATFDGQGFGSRNMSQCIFTPTSRSGDTWKGSQTCTDSYSKERVAEALSITVANDSRFTQENRWGRSTFDLCPNVKLSDYTG